MLPVGFIFVAVALRLIGGFAYLSAVIRGKAQPYPLSWLLWGITPMIAFAAEINVGVGPSSLVTFTLGVTPLMVFISAMLKNPKWLKLDALNMVCGLIAVGGIILWLLTDEPVLAIVISIIADFFSGLPTIRKTIKRPRSEYAPTYLMSALAMVVTIFAVQSWSFAAGAFPIYVLTVNLFMVWIITTRRK